MKFTSTEEKLKERIKELTCLYEISKIISQSDSVNKGVLEEIILSIKRAWRYNDDTIVEIQILEHTLSTSKIKEQTVFQTCSIQITNKYAGFIKIHYPQAKYAENDFLEDEQKLLTTIAFEIGNFIEKHQILNETALLNRTIERLDRLNLLGEMTAGIAHELNSPLGNILGFAELIKSNATDPKIISDVSIIINAAIFSREIVKKLLFFSCEIPQQLKLQELQPIINFVLAFLKPNFQKKDIKSEVLISDNAIMANVDSVQITQVLFNLFLNALYASPKKSTIKIEVQSTSENILITIADQGSGIHDDIKQKIFDPFFTTKPINEGCGLGLSIVLEIIKKHNGEIVLKNNFPAGTIFIIKLPANQ
ncbi:phospho-acceptor domain-containing protein [Flavobacterium sp. 270]|uniref:sensor histidine kinase n=1 Tax=Flavobacterium sp. 270 TaxID=2512114 RepID=UPI0010664982|nr:ATP-binding protein [Flavobacterium sp. 270]TDW48016.1 phospho-acceptor domain-containing protein [Flavobacterium sp. 270]